MCDIQLYDDVVLIAFMCLNAVSGCLSIMGSSVIIYMMLKAGGQKLRRTQNRLLFAMSIIDILNSIALGLSFIPTPISSCTRGLGNITTCTTQGFFIQLGLAVPGYIAMLSINCYMSIVQNVSEQVIVEKYERTMHVIALFPMLTVAMTGAVTKSFYGHYAQCYVGENECVEDCRDFGGGEWIIICSVIWCISMAIIIFSSMLVICLKIRKRAIARRKWDFRPSRDETKVERQPSRIDLSVKKAVNQSLLYVFAYVLTYLPTTIHLLFPKSSTSVAYIITYLAQATFLPLQGFWNFFIYIRPRYLAIRERNDLSFLSTCQAVLSSKNDENRGRMAPNRMRRRLAGCKRRNSYSRQAFAKNDINSGHPDDAPDSYKYAHAEEGDSNDPNRQLSADGLNTGKEDCSDEILTAEDFLNIKNAAIVFSELNSEGAGDT